MSKAQYLLKEELKALCSSPPNSKVRRDIYIENCELDEIKEIAERDGLHLFTPEETHKPKYFILILPDHLPNVRIQVETSEYQIKTILVK